MKIAAMLPMLLANRMPFSETVCEVLQNPDMVKLMGAQFQRHGGQAEGKDREPWSWVRTHGKGRVFYTAWGHDTRTWTNRGFSSLVERGIRWACGKDVSVVPAFADPEAFTAPKMTELRKDVAPFEYVEVGPKIPNYTPGRCRATTTSSSTIQRRRVSRQAKAMLTKTICVISSTGELIACFRPTPVRTCSIRGPVLRRPPTWQKTPPPVLACLRAVLNDYGWSGTEKNGASHSGKFIANSCVFVPK